MAKGSRSELSQQQLRLRVFAGPNGSGKSTIISSVRGTEIEGKPIDFGCYINADDIASELEKGEFSFASFEVNVSKKSLADFAVQSGLINQDFTEENLLGSFKLKGNVLTLKANQFSDRLAQIIARYLRELLLADGRRFSFETVFSHESNIDIMQRAVAAGYKVYFYFVSTESATINQYRVALRVKQGGHFVAPDKIEKRYYRSLNLMYKAAQLAYQAFFFDNSIDDRPYRLAARFKMAGEKREWDVSDQKQWPEWFKQYYVAKEIGTL